MNKANFSAFAALAITAGAIAFTPAAALADPLESAPESAPESGKDAAPAQTASPAQVDQFLNAGQDAEAFALAQSGADLGHAELTGYLGWFYEQGRHVAADPDQAVRLFRKAADMGDAYAQWRLGVLIDEGTATGTLQEALTLFRKAAGQKHADALVSLAVMHAGGRGTEQDFVAAMRYYQAAALRGNSHGLQGIGIMHANGEGVPADFNEALAYWMVASAAGNETADTLLSQYFPALSDEEGLAVITRAEMLARIYGVALGFEVADASDENPDL
jgi:TPR repeat protein